MTERELREYIIDTLQNQPTSWSFSAHTATYGPLIIWTSNRPYADLTGYYGCPVKSFRGRIWDVLWRRRLRRALDDACRAQVGEAIQKARPK